MIEIITREKINNLPDKTFIEGCVFIVDYTPIKKEKTTYFDGSIQTTDGNIPFKVWSNEKAYSQLQCEDFRNNVCFIKAEINNFKGSSSIIIKEIEKSILYKEDDFYVSVYDTEKLKTELENILEKNLSERGLEVIDLLLLKNENYDRFCKEYAAKSNHDNCRSGLLAHTIKMLKSLMFKIDMYPELLSFDTKKEDAKDLLIIGATMHDFGKIKEMHNGVYQPLSEIGHRGYGLMHIQNFKNIIEVKYNEKWFFDLYAIISQHHDEYAERSNKVASFIIHLIDEEDATLTKIETKLKNDFCSNSVGNFIEVDDRKLYF